MLEASVASDIVDLSTKIGTAKIREGKYSADYIFDVDVECSNAISVEVHRYDSIILGSVSYISHVFAKGRHVMRIKSDSLDELLEELSEYIFKMTDKDISANKVEYSETDKNDIYIGVPDDW